MDTVKINFCMPEKSAEYSRKTCSCRKADSRVSRRPFQSVSPWARRYSLMQAATAAVTLALSYREISEVVLGTRLRHVSSRHSRRLTDRKILWRDLLEKS